MTKRQMVYLHPDDVARLKVTAISLGERTVGSLLRRLVSKALIAHGLTPLTPIRVGYPKGRKRR